MKQKTVDAGGYVKLSYSDLYFAVIAGLVAVSMFFLGGHDYDILWHSKVGEYIVRNACFPTTDVFSWIGMEVGSKYTCHSWAFGVLVFFLDQMLGIQAASLVLSFVGAFSMFLLVKCTLFRGRHSAVLVLAVVTGMMSSNPRPQLVSFPLLFCTLLLLQRMAEGVVGTKSLLLLFPIGMAWSNFHGGMAPVFLGISVFYSFCFLLPRTRFFGFSFGWERNLQGEPVLLETFQDKLRKSVATVLVSFSSVLANPYFFKVLTYGFLENDSDVKRYIGEWQNGTIANLFSIVSIVSIVLYFATRERGEFAFYKVAPAICCLAAGAVYSRFLQHAFVASLFILPDVFSLRKRKPWSNKSWGVYCTVVVPVVVLAFASVFVPVAFERDNSLSMDEDLVAFLKEERFERMYNQHNDGAFLIYEGLLTFIDSRFTKGEVMTDGIEAESLAWEELSFDSFWEKYRFDAFLVNKKDNTALEEYLRMRGDFSNVFENDKYAIFVPAL